MPETRNVRALVATVLFVSACTQREQHDETQAPTVAPVTLAPAVAPPVVPSALGTAVPDASSSPPLADDDDPRSCRFRVPEQSCIPGTDQVDWSCRTECADACTSCKSGCVATDGGTAGTLPGCENACLTARDTCASTRCPQEVAAWLAEIERNHGCKAKSTAFAICTRAAKCMTACRDEDEHGPCHAACERRLAAGCDRAFLDDVEMGICNPYDLSP